jgi:hypothetical protein
MAGKLVCAWVLSSLALLGAQQAAAHEVAPAIADLEHADGTVTMRVELNLEAYLSGIDLDGLANINEAAGSDTYDRLRALEPDALAERAPGLVDRWNAVPLVSADGTPVTLEIEGIDVAPIGNTDLPRPTILRLTGEAPSGPVTVNWPNGAGDMVLRQQGVEEPFTGYVSGGEASPPLTFTGG